MELVPPVSPDPLPWVIAFKARDADAELALTADLETEAETAAGPVGELVMVGVEAIEAETRES